MIPFQVGLAFPDDNVPESEKLKPDFGRNAGRALYFRWYSSTAPFSYNNQTWMQEVRNYGEGRQDAEKYKNWFTNGSPIGNQKAVVGNSGNSNPTAGMSKLQRKGLANISYDIYNPFAKMSNVLLAMMQQNDYKVECQSLDRATSNAKLYRKAEIFVKSKLVNPLAERLRLPQMRVPFVPKDEAQLDMMDRLGFFKSEMESAFELLGEYSLRSSRFNDIRQLYNRDAIDYHFRCVKLYNCPLTGQVKVKYIDPTKLIMIWNEDKWEDPTAIGHVEMMDIQSIYPNLIAAGFNDEQISAMAKQWLTFYGNNAGYVSWWFERKDPVTNRWKWLDFKVPVLDFHYLSTDYKQYEEFEKDGETIYKKKETIDRKNPKGQKYDNYKCSYWYSGKYIVAGQGQDMVFDWHKVPNQMQKGLTPKCPYVLDRILGKAPTQRVMGLLDDLMFAVCKLRAAVWAAAPKGYTIDIGNAANITIGGQEYNVFDLMHVHRQNGLRIVKTAFNAQNQKYQAAVLEENDNGLGPQGQEWVAQINNILNMIMDAVGIPPVMAVTPNQSSERVAGVMEIDQEAFSYANSTLIESERSFKERIVERVIHQTRIDLEYDPKIREFYETALGENRVKTIMEMKDLSLNELAISTKSKPTEKQKDAIMQTAMEMSRVATRDGHVMLTPSDVEHVRALLNNDQIDEARWFMAETEQSHRAQQEATAAAAQQATIKGQQESAMIAEQAKQQTYQLEYQLKGQQTMIEEEEKRKTLQMEYDLKLRNDSQTINLKSDREDNQIALEGTIEAATGRDIKNPNNLK